MESVEAEIPVFLTPTGKGRKKVKKQRKLEKKSGNKIEAIGLNVVSTVCDQASANCSAINQLIADTRAEHIRMGSDWDQKCNRFEVNQISVIALYDVPHLFKGLRNHFQHIADCYAIDQEEEVGSLRLCPNLTDRHINLLQSSYKMKVKYCTQVLSRPVAAMINYFAKKDDICAAAKQTALVILFLDQLFDSLNSSSRDGTGGKPLTSALSAHSDHWKFWRIACKVLQNLILTALQTKQMSHWLKQNQYRQRLNRSSWDVNKWNELADSKQQLVMLQLNVIKKEHGTHSYLKVVSRQSGKGSCGREDESSPSWSTQAPSSYIEDPLELGASTLWVSLVEERETADAYMDTSEYSCTPGLSPHSESTPANQNMTENTEHELETSVLRSKSKMQRKNPALKFADSIHNAFGMLNIHFEKSSESAVEIFLIQLLFPELTQFCHFSWWRIRTKIK
ncbi:hypothetical protein CBL_10564 [Carabus blaptoides fortunei]